jgi:GNAT superfamily N-acetyltransferase
MVITIRKAVANDVEQITALIDRSVRALSVGYYSDLEIERALACVFGVDSQLIADGTFYVATDEDRIVGCGGWGKRRTLYGGDQFVDRVDDELDPASDAARIRAFFVDPSYARRGIGTSILKECEAAATQAGFTRAEMGATLPGVPLYAALGYTGDEVIDIDLNDGYFLRCIRMEKKLVCEEKASTPPE